VLARRVPPRIARSTTAVRASARHSFGLPRWWPDAIAVCAVIVLFCTPLFIKLGVADLQNDEATYAYAIDRVLETGDWLTPRAIPHDNAFLEKPPLKFWMVAAPIEAGLLPHDEFGFRFLDALAGTAAFVYVYLLGRTLVGPLCGVIAAFVLVTQGQLVFVHGLRSNNMESALVLSYCGGVFHFLRWIEGEPARNRSRQALAVATWFAFGFMTKFVAALFLPLVCGVAVLWRAGGLRLAAARWREWVLPLLIVIATVVPWFAYQTAKSGADVWLVMFNQHVVTRMTSALDVSHLKPWHFYLTELWRELGRAGSRAIVTLGLCALLWAAWRERSWGVRVLLLWALVPLAIISAGTSKLYHYEYPFLPPLALGAGYLAVGALRGMNRALAPPPPAVARTLDWLQRVVPDSRRWRRSAIVLGAVALLVAVWTVVAGSIGVEIGGVPLLSNSSVLRPVVIMIIFWCAALQARLAARVAIAVAILALLPWRGYERTFTRLRAPGYPLRAVGGCIRSLQATEPVGAPGVYNAATTMNSNSYFYYWRDLGWQKADERRLEEVRRRLVDADAQSPILLSARDYDVWRRSGESRDVARLLGRQPGGIAPDSSLVMLLPGRYEVCVAPAVMAGARPIGGTPRAIGEAHR
jgi:4-amino-4-deoxy-L-arabinose transferase-like glycosyltransferase